MIQITFVWLELTWQSQSYSYRLVRTVAIDYLQLVSV